MQEVIAEDIQNSVLFLLDWTPPVFAAWATTVDDLSASWMSQEMPWWNNTKPYFHDDVDKFDDEALQEIANKAIECKTGGAWSSPIIEETMLDVMSAPLRKLVLHQWKKLLMNGKPILETA